MPIITTGMLRDPGSETGNHACLTLKAWNTRVFAVYLNECLVDCLATHPGASDSDPELLLAAAATRSLVLWFLEQEKGQRFLTAAEASAIAEHGRNYLQLVEALARHATQHRILRWKLLPKHHEHQLQEHVF